MFGLSISGTFNVYYIVRGFFFQLNDIKCVLYNTTASEEAHTLTEKGCAKITAISKDQGDNIKVNPGASAHGSFYRQYVHYKTVKRRASGESFVENQSGKRKCLRSSVEPTVVNFRKQCFLCGTDNVTKQIKLHVVQTE